MAKIKIGKAAALQSRADVERAIGSIGFHQRALERIETSLKTTLARLKAATEERAKVHLAPVKPLVAAVKKWCTAHRAELLAGDEKSHEFATGRVRWRLKPPSVKVDGEEGVIEQLQACGLHRFLRRKVELDKEAILKEPDAIAGITGLSIEQGEQFEIEPFGVELAQQPEIKVAAE